MQACVILYDDEGIVQLKNIWKSSTLELYKICTYTPYVFIIDCPCVKVLRIFFPITFIAMYVLLIFSELICKQVSLDMHV
jgi:hypothetical protein